MIIRTEALEKRTKLQANRIEELENGSSRDNIENTQEDSLYLSGRKIEDLHFMDEIVTKRTLDLSEFDL